MEKDYREIHKSTRDRIYTVGISLGTGCSVVVIDPEGNWLCGYEEERFTKNKRESSFPINALDSCLDIIPGGSFICVGVSHWFNKSSDPSINRYLIDIRYYIESRDYNVLDIIEKDHHYLHNISSLGFFDFDEYKKINSLVVDGFGNNESVITIYNYEKGSHLNHINLEKYKSILLRSLEYSVGLFFEAATKASGLKPKGDEYKLLGYESRISEHYPVLEALDGYIENFVEELSKDYTAEGLEESKSLVRYEKLDEVDKKWSSMFNKVKYELKLTEEAAPIVIGYIAQSTIEKRLIKLIKNHDLHKSDLILSGGVFYNVKLNYRILEIMEEGCNLFIVPVCGDQGGSIGAAINVFRNVMRTNPKKTDLLIGHRQAQPPQDIPVEDIAKHISDGKIVNLAHGDMEFGPRALCNTSTLCLPLKKNVEYINHLNNRDVNMPMAPVMLERNVEYFFDKSQYEKVSESCKYMIITLKYKNEYSKSYAGVMHNYPDNSGYSGRPQVIHEEDSVIGRILNRVEELTGSRCIINTSFNIHGTPICLDIEDIEYAHHFQKERDVESRVITYNGL